MEYLGQVYPRGSNEPPWPTRPHRALLRDVDAVLLRDPYLWGFLGVRGHLLESQGDHAGCDGDFDLLERLSTPTRYLGHCLHRAWATAKTRPKAAVSAASRVKLRDLSSAEERREVLEFLSLDSLMLGISQTTEVLNLRRTIGEPSTQRRKKPGAFGPR